MSELENEEIIILNYTIEDEDGNKVTKEFNPSDDDLLEMLVIARSLYDKDKSLTEALTEFLSNEKDFGEYLKVRENGINFNK